MDLWLAFWDNSLTVKPKTDWAFIAIKQYGATTSVNGISGNVDGNVFFGDIATFKKYGYQGAATPPPTPDPEPTECEKEVVRLNSMINDLREDLGTAEGTINSLNVELETLGLEYDKLQDDYELADSGYKTALDEVMRLTDEVADLQKELEDCSKPTDWVAIFRKLIEIFIGGSK